MNSPRPPGALWPPPDLLQTLNRERAGRDAAVGLVLGSGLGGIADALETPWSRDGAAIAGYPQSTVAGHRGRLLWGRLAGTAVWIVQGRVHLYEGYTREEVTRPVRLLQALGVRTLILTNAAGSLDPLIRPGDLVAVSDAFAFPTRETTRGGARAGMKDAEALPWRSRPPLVDPALLRLTRAVALEEGLALPMGVLAASLGPAYETAAEVAAYRRLGGSVATMSTVPEALEARMLGLRCLILSLITNLATGLAPAALEHQEVVERAGEASQRLQRLLAALLPRL